MAEQMKCQELLAKKQEIMYNLINLGLNAKQLDK